MKSAKKVTIDIPAYLIEMGLTESELNNLIQRWSAIDLFRRGRLTAAEAGRLLRTDLDGFLAILDEWGIPHDNVPQGRPSPLLNEKAELENRLEAVKKELAQIKQQFTQARKQAQEAERLQSDFLATVSHELRTPLNSIIGFAKLLLNQTVGPLNQIQQTDLSYIYDSAQHLLGLVNDILDLSKIKAGKIRLDMEWLTVEETIVGVMASTYILVGDKPIKLQEEIESRLPKIYIDRGRIRQVVLNILSNAAKFTDAGSITLRIFKRTRDGQEFICFSVTDTGIGIAKEDMDKVFEAFRQIDSSEGRRAEGTGLGMPISYRLIQLHGGELWLESVVGQGSTFYFTIPVQPPKVVDADVVHADYRISQ